MEMKSACTGLFMLVQGLLPGFAHAACNLERFGFGTSAKAFEEKLGERGMALPLVGGGESKEVLFVPGEAICVGEKAFQGTPVEFTFLYDELVQIEALRLSTSPVLAAWAEAVYGKKEDKPRSFYDVQPNAQWLWDTFNSAIAYSITTRNGDIRESVIIQSQRHALNFGKFAKEEEEQLNGRRP